MLKNKNMGQRREFFFVQLRQNIADFFVDLFPMIFAMLVFASIGMTICYIYFYSVTGVNAFILIISSFSLFIIFISFLITWTSFAKKVGHEIVVDYNHEFSPQESQLSGIPYIAHLYLYNKKNKTEVIKKIFIQTSNGHLLELKNFQDKPLVLPPFADKSIALKPVTAYAENLTSKDISNEIFTDSSKGLHLVIEKIPNERNPTFYHIENNDEVGIISKEEIVKKRSIFSDKLLKIIIRTDETLIFSHRVESNDKYDALIPFHNDYEFKDYYKSKSFDNSVFRAYSLKFGDGKESNFTLSIGGVSIFEYDREKNIQLMLCEQDEFKKRLDLDENLKIDFSIKVNDVRNVIFPAGHKLNDEQIDLIAKTVCFLDVYLKNLGEKTILKKNIRQFNSSLYETKNLQEYLQKSNKKS